MRKVGSQLARAVMGEVEVRRLGLCLWCGADECVEEEGEGEIWGGRRRGRGEGGWG